MNLGQIGEFAILRDHLIPALGQVGKHLGDDCSILPITEDISIVLTSDRGARPLAWSLPGLQIDYADAGWLAVVASVSDLATAGARPFAITNDIEAPGTMPIEQLTQFAKGVAEACEAFELHHGGGDLARSNEFTTHTAAIGLLNGKHFVGRHHCEPNDCVFALGPMGALASAYLHARREGLNTLCDAERAALLRPRPQLTPMRALVGRGLVNAASDCSDGVIGALLNIVEASGLGIELIPDSIDLPLEVIAEASASHLSPWNLFFFWGDWQVVATARSDRIDEVKSLIGNTQLRILGRVIDSPRELVARQDSRLFPVAAVRNENFKSVGFASSLDDHLDFMLTTKIF